jgi:hypothetical protein
MLKMQTIYQQPTSVIKHKTNIAVDSLTLSILELMGYILGLLIGHSDIPSRYDPIINQHQ